MKTLLPRQAFDFLQSHPDTLFIDCRSEHEHLLVGHPVVPVPGRDEPLRPQQVLWADEVAGEFNEHFAEDVARLAGGDLARPVLVFCRSGRRSASACQALAAAGFTHAIDLAHGFEGDADERFQRGHLNGWRHDGLPWEQM